MSLTLGVMEFWTSCACVCVCVCVSRSDGVWGVFEVLSVFQELNFQVLSVLQKQLAPHGVDGVDLE